MAKRKKKLVGEDAAPVEALDVAVDIAPAVDVEPVDEKPVEPGTTPNEVFIDESGVECVRVTQADGKVVVVPL